MMTGDWAAAVWYQGLGNDANWLTDYFVAPGFSTGTPFVNQSYDVWNDSRNPVWDDPCQPDGPYDPASSQYDNGDTAWSTVKNTTDNKLLITIYYEVVDLGEYSGSPIAYRDTVGKPVYIKSERYVLLQTYVFENIHDTQNILGLEFYQMLHGHPTGDYPINTNSM